MMTIEREGATVTEPTFEVRTIERNTWAVVRGRDRVFVTTDWVAAVRTKDELNRADRRAFYEGLIVGASERSVK